MTRSGGERFGVGITLGLRLSFAIATAGPTLAPPRPDERDGTIDEPRVPEAALRYLIVGNGVAGIEAALVLREREPSSSIAIVSEEHDHFFSRPALMYVFAGQLSLRDAEPFGRSLYERLGFERVRGRVVGLDASRRTLALAAGPARLYDRLLLALGSVARPSPWPGSRGPGLHSFVTLRDLEGLDREARPGLRAVVVGGGLIGVEVAEILRQRGLLVTFVVRESWYFPVALDAE